MTDELQQYYDKLLELFGTEGWQVFVEEAKNSLTGLVESSSIDCIDNDKWQYRRGEINKLHQIVNYENFIRQSMDSHEENFDEDSL